MDLEVEWTNTALELFASAIQYLRGRNETAAEKVRQDILRYIELLPHFPFIGPKFEKARSELVREIVCRKYRIIYEVDEKAKRIRILSVWHGSRSEPEIPE
jgi:plasmid stabilization system protein ParE